MIFRKLKSKKSGSGMNCKSPKGKKVLVFSALVLLLVVVVVGVFLLLKTNASGGQLVWESSYSPITTSSSNGSAKDSNGNLYMIASTNAFPGQGIDYGIFKYDSSGNKVKEVFYNDQYNGDDEASNILLDSNNNVYVSGREQTSSGKDVFVKKYDTNLNLLWSAIYPNPSESESIIDAKIGPDGNICVLFDGLNSYNYNTAILVKYNTDGSLSGSLFTSSSTSSISNGVGFFFDQSGNIYVGSRLEISGNTVHYYLVKTDGLLNLLWEKRYTGNYGEESYLKAMAMDDSGIYLTGWLKNLTSTGTVKYGFDGTQLWAAQNTSLVPYSIYVNSSGVYVTVEDSSNQSSIVKYDLSTGTQLALVPYASGKNINVNYIKNAGGTDFYIIGNVNTMGQDGSVMDVYIGKFNSAGTELWSKVYTQPYNNGYDNSWESINNIDVDSNYNLYVCVTEYTLFDSANPRSAIVVIQPNGGENYTKQTETVNKISDESVVQSFYNSNNGSLLEVGNSTSASTGMNNIFVGSFGSSDGNKGNFTLDNSLNEWANDAAINSSQEIFVAGYTKDLSGNKNSLIVKYNSNGFRNTSIPEDLGNGLDDEAVLVAIDNSGNIYVASKVQKSTGTSDYDVVLAKYDSWLNKQWSATYTGIGDKDDLPISLLVNSNQSEVYLVLSSDGTTLDGRGVVYDMNSGSQKSDVSLNDIPSVAKMSPDGYIYLGFNNGFIKKVDNGFNTVSSYQISGNIISINDITFDSSGKIYATGALMNGGVKNAFAARLDNITGSINLCTYNQMSLEGKKIVVDQYGTISIAAMGGSNYGQIVNFPYGDCNNLSSVNFNGSYNDLVMDDYGNTYLSFSGSLIGGTTGLDLIAQKYSAYGAPNHAPTVTLISPNNSISLNSNPVYFTVHLEDTDGDQVAPNIQVSTDSNFNTIVWSSSTQNNFMSPPVDQTYSTNLNSGHYYWRAMAFDNRGGQSQWSETWQFDLNTGGGGCLEAGQCTDGSAQSCCSGQDEPNSNCSSGYSCKEGGGGGEASLLYTGSPDLENISNEEPEHINDLQPTFNFTYNNPNYNNTQKGIKYIFLMDNEPIILGPGMDISTFTIACSSTDIVTGTSGELDFTVGQQNCEYLMGAGSIGQTLAYPDPSPYYWAMVGFIQDSSEPFALLTGFNTSVSNPYPSFIYDSNGHPASPAPKYVKYLGLPDDTTYLTKGETTTENQPTFNFEFNDIAPQNEEYKAFVYVLRKDAPPDFENWSNNTIIFMTLGFNPMSGNPPTYPMPISFKVGQVANPDYFESYMAGHEGQVLEPGNYYWAAMAGGNGGPVPGSVYYGYTGTTPSFTVAEKPSDTTAPLTSYSISGTAEPAPFTDWYQGVASVTLTATDDVSTPPETCAKPADNAYITYSGTEELVIGGVTNDTTPTISFIVNQNDSGATHYGMVVFKDQVGPLDPESNPDIVQFFYEPLPPNLPVTITKTFNTLPAGHKYYIVIALVKDGVGLISSSMYTGYTNPCPSFIIGSLTGGTPSGVAKTEYSLSGATTLGWTTYTGPITISVYGETIIHYKSTDNAGNIETEKTVSVKIDKDSDGDGIYDNLDACPNGSPTDKKEYQGCPAAIYAIGDLHVVYKGSVIGYAGVKDGKEKKSAKMLLAPGPVGDSRSESVTSVTTKVYTQPAVMTVLGSKDFDKNIKYKCSDIYGIASPTVQASITTNPQLIGVPKADNYITATKVTIFDEVDGITRTAYVCRKINTDKFNYDYNKDRVKEIVAKMKNKVMKSIKDKCDPSKDPKKICVQVTPGDEDELFIPADLNVTYPEQVNWPAGVTSHLYEFILESTTNWTVKACASMPSGYKAIAAYDADGNPLTISSNCVSNLLVSNGSTVITFEVQGLTTASTFDTKFTFTAKYGTSSSTISKVIKNIRLKAGVVISELNSDPNSFYEKYHLDKFQSRFTQASSPVVQEESILDKVVNFVKDLF